MKLKSFSIVNLVVFALVSCGVGALPSSNPSSTSDLSSLINDSSLVETD